MRQMRKFTGIGTGMVVGATFATILGVSAHGGDVAKIHACVDQAGNLKIVDASATCKKNEVAVDWNIQGVKGDAGAQGIAGAPGSKGDKGDQGEQGVAGPPGAFTGTFKSPDQSYGLMVTDAGIELTGPTTLVRLGPGGIEIASDGAVSIESAAKIDIKTAGPLTLKGSIIIN
jgi:hypothetical protein